MPGERSLTRRIDRRGSTRVALTTSRAGDGVDRLIADLAARQYGVVGRRQLEGGGIRSGQIELRLRRGRMQAIHRGVYTVGHPVVPARGRWMAAVLASGPGAVLSHRSAGRLWQVLDWGHHPQEVIRRRGWRAGDGILVHRCALRDDETTEVDGIPVTTVPRTLFDLASVLDRPRLEGAMNEVEVRRLTDRLSIADLLARHPRHRGNQLLRSLVAGDAATRGVTKRELEVRFRSFVDAAALPRPRFNADLAVGGRFFEVDCLWPQERLIVELDGRASHDTRRAFESDRERDRALMLEGWRVTRVTWRALHQGPTALAAELRALLAISA